MDSPFDLQAFRTLDDARAIAQFLILQDLESRFSHITQARIAYLVQLEPLRLHGQAAAACIGPAVVQGQHRSLFEFLTADDEGQPIEFIVYFDAGVWHYLAQVDELGPSGFPIGQERIVYHELSHLRHIETRNGTPRYHQDGRPMLATVRHTYEFFDHELRRYGPKTTGLTKIADDFAEGQKTERHRERHGRIRRVK